MSAPSCGIGLDIARGAGLGFALPFRLTRNEIELFESSGILDNN
jgi:phosphatidylinositol kinase/protein kinase (PI-3  family)